MALITDPDLLTQGTEIVFDAPNKTIQLIKAGNLSDDGVTLQCVYSFCKEEWKTDDNLIKYPFPILAITEEKFELISGWDWKDQTTKNLIRTGGWALNPAGTIQEEYAGIITLGSIENGQAYYQQEPDGPATNFVLTGAVNQAIKIYGDAEHGNFNYKSYLKIFCREYAKTYAFSQIEDIGVTTMTYQVYRFPLAIYDDLKIIATDEVVDSEAPYTGMSIRWFTTPQSRTIGGTSYDFNVIIDGNGGTAEQIYTFVQRQLRKNTDIDAGAGTKIGKVTPVLLRFIGDSLYTLRWTVGEGTYIDDHQEIDRTRLYFLPNTGSYIQFPYAAILTLNFGDNLVNDPDAIYRVFFTNDDAGANLGRDYETEFAILVDTFKSQGTVNRQRSSNVATIQTDVAHELSVGDGVRITGMGGSGAMYAVAKAPTSGGTGYTVGDILTVSEGTGGQVKVTAVSGGVVTAVSLYARGTAGYTVGTGKATTGGTGSGCTIEITSAGYNGNWIVTSVPTSTTFTFANIGANETETADTGGTVYRTMVGKVGGVSSKQFTFDFDNNVQRGSGSEGEDAPITVVAIGLSTAQFVKATGTIERTLTNSVALVAALERNYSNP